MGYETLKVKKEGGVAVITLSRPDKLNALNPKMGEELVEVLDEISKDDTVRAVVITGEGRAFCAGGDVREDIAPLSELSPFEFTEYFERMMDAYKKIVKMDKPVIAAVNGYAVGAGLDLMMSCDIRIASEEAKLGQFFVRMGLTPEVGVWLMPRLIGLGRAKLLSFTGDLIDAREAERIGLVEKVVPADKLMEEAMSLARRLAEGPTKAIGVIKRAMHTALWTDVDTALAFVTRMQYQLVHTEDHKEAVRAFIEGRKPEFKGR